MDATGGRPPRRRPWAEVLSRIAREGKPVLLRGGSTHECSVIAREVHELSGVEGPFVRYTCRPLTRQEQQERSLAQRCGDLFGRAEGGTLYFHAVENLSETEQRQLYSVLERGEYWLPDELRLTPTRFRIIASARAELRASKLPPDLVFRLGERVIDLTATKR